MELLACRAMRRVIRHPQRRKEFNLEPEVKQRNASLVGPGEAWRGEPAWPRGRPPPGPGGPRHANLGPLRCTQEVVTAGEVMEETRPSESSGCFLQLRKAVPGVATRHDHPRGPTEPSACLLPSGASTTTQWSRERARLPLPGLASRTGETGTLSPSDTWGRATNKVIPTTHPWGRSLGRDTVPKRHLAHCVPSKDRASALG